MTLDELIKALEAEGGHGRVLPLGFGNPHSYRGFYDELAFEPLAGVTVGQMLADARRALGATYEGWKGGEYTMKGYTDCWLAEQGSTSPGETIGPTLLTCLLTSDELSDGSAARLRRIAGECRRWSQRA